MKVTKVWINQYEKGNLLGYANIQFSLLDSGDGCMTIRDWSIWSNDNVITVGMPSKPNPKEEGKYFNSVTLDTEKPEASDFLNHVTEEVAKAYRATTNKSSEQRPPATQPDNSNLKEGFESEDALLPF